MTDRLLHESWLEKLERARCEDIERDADPYIRILQRSLPPDGTAVTTYMIAEMLGLKANSTNAQRIADTMRAMGYFPIRTARTHPGKWKDTIARGWFKPKPKP